MSVEYIPENCQVIDSGKCDPNPNPEGYGDRIPTRWIVKFPGENKEYKVWAICYSNAASHYIIRNGRKFVPDWMFP